MFSVNNFYNIFNSRYGWPQKNSIPWVFTPHGSKDWLDITLLTSGNELIFPAAYLMHDQEPFFVDSMQQLKNDLLNLDNKTLTAQYALLRAKNVDVDFLNTLTPEETLLYYVKSTKVPILCHSEINSKDITHISEHNFIPCYYWWHGMIARDWFRHWEYHDYLKPYNKSLAEYRFLFYCRAVDGTREYRQKVNSQLKTYSTLTSDSNTGAEASATIDVTHANSSAIHIVAETLFKTEKIYLTEKVFKPMVMSQPFILLSGPKSLEYLRNYGFKTFAEVWPEEYDLIADHNDRKAAILDLISWLEHLPQSEFDTLYSKTLPIIEHNRKHFYSSEFKDILWAEFTTNVNHAIDLQNSLIQDWPGGTDLYMYNKQLLLTGKLSPRQISQIQNLVKFGAVKKDWVLRRYPVFRDLL